MAMVFKFGRIAEIQSISFLFYLSMGIELRFLFFLSLHREGKECMYGLILFGNILWYHEFSQGGHNYESYIKGWIWIFSFI